MVEISGQSPSQPVSHSNATKVSSMWNDWSKLKIPHRIPRKKTKQTLIRNNCLCTAQCDDAGTEKPTPKTLDAKLCVGKNHMQSTGRKRCATKHDRTNTVLSRLATATEATKTC